MKRWGRSAMLRWGLFVLGLAPGIVAAAPDTYASGPLVFQTTGQSMWGSGAAFVLDVNKFVGTSWDTGKSFGPGVECFLGVCGGFEVNVGTDGKVGFQFGLKAYSGSVDATVQYHANATLPEPGVVHPLQFFNLNPNSLLSGGELKTTSPTLAAKAEAVLGARATFGGEACIFACVSGSTGVGFGSKDDPKILELVSLNENGTGAIEILNNTGPYNLGQVIPITPGGTNVGNVTVFLPQIDTLGGVDGSKLKSSGHDDMLDLKVDIDGVVTLGLGLPPLEGDFSVLGLDVSYNLIDVEFGPILEALQDFELNPTLWVELQFDHPIYVAGNPNPVSSLIAPWDLLPDIAMISALTEVTPTFFITNLFTNETGLGVDGELTVDALSGSIEGVGGFGPLFNPDPFRFNIGDFPPLFDETFALAGFNVIQGDPFLIQVPEPPLLPLLATALLALAYFGRTRRAARG